MNVDTTPNLTELRGHVTRLKELLDDPQPGLITWLYAYEKQMNLISDFWNGEQTPEPQPCEHAQVQWTSGTTGTRMKIGICMQCGDQIERNVA